VAVQPDFPAKTKVILRAIGVHSIVEKRRLLPFRLAEITRDFGDMLATLRRCCAWVLFSVVLRQGRWIY